MNRLRQLSPGAATKAVFPGGKRHRRLTFAELLAFTTGPSNRQGSANRHAPRVEQVGK
jgi:hypothetical protein